MLARQYRMSDWREQCLKDEPDMDHEEKPVFLNDHTWIGAGAIILPGVQIKGKGVVVQREQSSQKILMRTMF